MRRKALRTLLIVATTIALVGCGHKNDHNGIEVVETPLEETEPFSEEPEVVVEEEPLYVAPERLPEWDEPSDYLRIQIDDVIYKQGSTFGEIWEGLMSSKEDYTFTKTVYNEVGEFVGEEEYIYDPDDTNWHNNEDCYSDRTIYVYKNGEKWASIAQVNPKKKKASEIYTAINPASTESAYVARYINGMSLMELQEHTGEELLEWKNTILSDIEWGYSIDPKTGENAVGDIMSHYDKQHKTIMFLTYNVKQDRTNQIVSIEYLYDYALKVQ